MVQNKLLPKLSQNLLEILNDEEYHDIIIEVELGLQELIPYLESYLIENKENWMEQNFDLIYQMSYENDSFLKLQNYCKDFIIKNPDKILKSLNTFSISEDLLLTILKDKDNYNNNNNNNNNIMLILLLK
ncbi:unnamed protein product [Rhizophagus irregularis]|nr:unnamed protein product [Rhizophagus irregularis]